MEEADDAIEGVGEEVVDGGARVARCTLAKGTGGDMNGVRVMRRV